MKRKARYCAGTLILFSAVSFMPTPAPANDSETLLKCVGTIGPHLSSKAGTEDIQFSVYIRKGAVSLSGASIYDAAYSSLSYHGDTLIFQKKNGDELIGNVNRVTGRFSFHDIPGGLGSGGRIKVEILAQCQRAERVF